VGVAYNKGSTKTKAPEFLHSTESDKALCLTELEETEQTGIALALALCP